MAHDSKTTVSGACLCRAVGFEVDLPSLFCAHCHCSMCQRNHGAGFVTWFGVPYTQFRIVRGSGQLRRFASSDHGTRSFCGICGSSLFCESTRHPEHLDIVLANMQGPIDRAPEIHVFFSDRARWIEVTDSLPKLGGESGLDPIKE
jgi:hypothetical protein